MLDLILFGGSPNPRNLFGCQRGLLIDMSIIVFDIVMNISIELCIHLYGYLIYKYINQILCDIFAHTVTPKTLSILTSMVVRTAHHQTTWELRLALVEV
jgi:hypothetical protein